MVVVEGTDRVRGGASAARPIMAKIPHYGERWMKRFTLSLLLVSLLVASGGCARFSRRQACCQPRSCCSCDQGASCKSAGCNQCPTCDQGPSYEPGPSYDESPSYDQGPSLDQDHSLGAAPFGKPAYIASRPKLQFPRSIRPRFNSDTPVKLFPAPKSEAGRYYPQFLVPGGK
jgi:hypothetical protein